MGREVSVCACMCVCACMYVRARVCVCVVRLFVEDKFQFNVKRGFFFPGRVGGT